MISGMILYLFWIWLLSLVSLFKNFIEPPRGIEPPAHALRMRCSTNLATVAVIGSILVKIYQFLTAWLYSLVTKTMATPKERKSIR